MDLKELRDEMNARFDHLEEKLDVYVAQVTGHEADLTWVKGFIRVTLSLIVTIVGGLVTYVISTLHK